MYLFMLMQHLQPQEYLPHDIGSDSFRNLLHILIDDIGECSSIHVLNQHEETVHVVVGGVVVDDVLIGAHRHHCSLDLDLMQYLLLRHLHHPHRPAFIRQLAVKCLVDRTHRTLTQLLGEPVDLVRVIRQKDDTFDLLIELRISEKSVIGNLLLLLKSSHDLDHHLRVVLNHILADIILIEQLHHLRS